MMPPRRPRGICGASIVLRNQAAWTLQLGARTNVTGTSAPIQISRMVGGAEGGWARSLHVEARLGHAADSALREVLAQHLARALAHRGPDPLADGVGQPLAQRLAD